MRPQHLNAVHYENMLQCVPVLAKVSNQLHDLQAILERLWPLYLAELNAANGDLGLEGFYNRFLTASSQPRSCFTEGYSQLQQARFRRWAFVC